MRLFLLRYLNLIWMICHRLYKLGEAKQISIEYDKPANNNLEEQIHNIKA